MSHVATRGGPSTGTPTEGSRTVLVQENQPREDETPREGVLRLRGGPRTHPRVTWNEDVIDNEGMGKKKSKICCIYHKPRRYDESSSESESESSDSDSGRAQPGGRLGQRRDNHHSDHCHQHCHPYNQSGESSGSGAGEAMHDGGGSVAVQELSDGEYEPNAYERQPGKGKGKGGTALDPNK